MASAGSRDVLDVNRRLLRAQRRWTVVMVAALLLGAVVYLLAVRTGLGQPLEDAALRGADQVDPEVHRVALRQFHTITVTSQVAAAVIVVLIGLLRRQLWLAVAGMTVIFGSQAVTQV